MLNTILFDLDGTLLPFWQDDFIHTYFKMLVACAAPMGYDGKQLTDAVWKGTAAMVENDGGVTNRQAFWETFTQEQGTRFCPIEALSASLRLAERAYPRGSGAPSTKRSVFTGRNRASSQTDASTMSKKVDQG